MAHKNSALVAATTALITGSLLFSGCSKDDELKRFERRPVSYRLTAMNDCDDVDTYIKGVLVEHLASQFRLYNGGGSSDGDAGGAPMPEPPAEAPSDDAAPDDYTETNTQEDGVDEADIVKTDGNYLYVAQNNKLHIVKSWPAEESETIAQIDLTGWAQELYLQDGLAVVVSSESEPCTDVRSCKDRPYYDYYYGYVTRSRVTVFDVSNPAEPSKVRDFVIEGATTTSRAVDGIVYLVVQSQAPSFYEQTAYALESIVGAQRYSDRYWQRLNSGLTESTYEAIVDYVNNHIDLAEFRDLVTPDVSVNGSEFQDAVSCANIYAPDAPGVSLNSTSLIAIDPSSDTLADGAGILADGWTVYGATESIYISRQSIDWRRDYYEFDSRTDIHRFALNAGKPTYASSGTVYGFQYDRFGFSERDGYLRVATTDPQRWWWGGWGGGDVVDIDAPVASPPPVADAGSSDGAGGTSGSAVTPKQTSQEYVQANNLFVLKEEGDELKIVGEVRGYGENESIYGIRYVGNMAYVVTFRQTDPLYAIDLSDPENPTIMGELKIPGFSNFLQSIGEGLLLGVGMDADDLGRTTGFHVQLFDVSDPTNPIRTSHQLYPFDEGYSSSIAQYESRAFTWYASRQLLSIPYSSYNYSNEGDTLFNGALVMRVTAENGIEEVGRVNHADFITSFCETYGESSIPKSGPSVAADMAMPYPDYYYEPCSQEWAKWNVQYQRSVFIGDWLFGISTFGLTISSINDVSNPIVALSFL